MKIPFPNEGEDGYELAIHRVQEWPEIKIRGAYKIGSDRLRKLRQKLGVVKVKKKYTTLEVREFLNYTRPGGLSGHLKKGNPKVRFGGYVFWTRDDRLAFNTPENTTLDDRGSGRLSALDALSGLYTRVRGYLS